eukprot:s177_g3.t1
MFSLSVVLFSSNADLRVQPKAMCASNLVHGAVGEAGPTTWTDARLIAAFGIGKMRTVTRHHINKHNPAIRIFLCIRGSGRAGFRGYVMP